MNNDSEEKDIKSRGLSERDSFTRTRRTKLPKNSESIAEAQTQASGEKHSQSELIAKCENSEQNKQTHVPVDARARNITVTARNGDIFSGKEVTLPNGNTAYELHGKGLHIKEADGSLCQIHSNGVKIIGREKILVHHIASGDGDPSNSLEALKRQQVIQNEFTQAEREGRRLVKSSHPDILPSEEEQFVAKQLEKNKLLASAQKPTLPSVDEIIREYESKQNKKEQNNLAVKSESNLVQNKEHNFSSLIEAHTNTKVINYEQTEQRHKPINSNIPEFFQNKVNEQNSLENRVSNTDQKYQQTESTAKSSNPNYLNHVNNEHKDLIEQNSFKNKLGDSNTKTNTNAGTISDSDHIEALKHNLTKNNTDTHSSVETLLALIGGGVIKIPKADKNENSKIDKTKKIESENTDEKDKLKSKDIDKVDKSKSKNELNAKSNREENWRSLLELLDLKLGSIQNKSSKNISTDRSVQSFFDDIKIDNKSNSNKELGSKTYTNKILSDIHSLIDKLNIEEQKLLGQVANDKVKSLNTPLDHLNKKFQLILQEILKQIDILNFGRLASLDRSLANIQIKNAGKSIVENFMADDKSVSPVIAAALRRIAKDQNLELVKMLLLPGFNSSQFNIFELNQTQQSTLLDFFSILEWQVKSDKDNYNKNKQNVDKSFESSIINSKDAMPSGNKNSGISKALDEESKKLIINSKTTDKNIHASDEIDQNAEESDIVSDSLTRLRQKLLDMTLEEQTYRNIILEKLFNVVEQISNAQSKNQLINTNKAKFHRVVAGDTFASIAKIYLGDESFAVLIYHFNRLAAEISPVLVKEIQYVFPRVGAIIRIPITNDLASCKSEIIKYKNLCFNYKTEDRITEPIFDFNKNYVQPLLNINRNTIKFDGAFTVFAEGSGKFVLARNVQISVEGSRNSDLGRSIKLEIFSSGVWVTVRKYQFNDYESRLLIYYPHGKTICRNINLPDEHLSNLIDNDFLRNWAQYVIEYLTPQSQNRT